jgi:hypothetical protein
MAHQAGITCANLLALVSMDPNPRRPTSRSIRTRCAFPLPGLPGSRCRHPYRDRRSPVHVSRNGSCSAAARTTFALRFSPVPYSVRGHTWLFGGSPMEGAIEACRHRWASWETCRGPSIAAWHGCLACWPGTRRNVVAGAGLPPRTGMAIAFPPTRPALPMPSVRVRPSSALRLWVAIGIPCRAQAPVGLKVGTKGGPARNRVTFSASC